MSIKKAIFPVAGFGTRFLPATKAQPKEMLPVVDKPAIQYLVEDAVSAGIEEIVFVTGRGKRSIEDHFDHSFELEYNLVEKNKTDLLKKVRQISDLAKFSYVRQPQPLGDGHAIACAAHLVNDEPILIVFGDCLYDSPVSTAKQVIDAYEKYKSPIIGLAEVPMDQTHMFGVIKGNDLGEGDYEVEDIVEKPKAEDAPSNLVAAGIYLINPEILKILTEMEKGKSGEIRLADAYDIYLKQGGKIYGRKLQGEWLDTGSKFGFLKATIKLGLKNEETGKELKEYLKGLQLQ